MVLSIESMSHLAVVVKFGLKQLLYSCVWSAKQFVHDITTQDRTTQDRIINDKLLWYW